MTRLPFMHLAVLLAAVLLLASPTSRAQAGGTERPDASMLQHGDLVWPRNPRSIVPYDSSSASTADAQKRQWEAERNAFVARVRDPARNATKQMLQLATNLEALSYHEFQSQYLANVTPVDISRYGGGEDLFYVGHVGIVEVAADGKRFVIEAVWGDVKMVQRIAYEEWLRKRDGAWVWVGRIGKLTAEQRNAFVTYARTQVGKPYDFWNFDLDDDTSFYCSKLAWQALARAAKLYADDREDPRRSFWFSPKQLWNSTHVLRINAPRDYAY